MTAPDDKRALSAHELRDIRTHVSAGILPRMEHVLRLLDEHDALRAALATRDAELAERTAERDSAQLGCEIAYLREPTQAEGDAHEDGEPAHAEGECFVAMGGWTGRRCRLCSRWVWGGPTECAGCAELAHLRNVAANRAWLGDAATNASNARAALERDLAEARAQLAREITLSEQRAVKLGSVEAELDACRRERDEALEELRTWRGPNPYGAASERESKP